MDQAEFERVCFDPLLAVSNVRVRNTVIGEGAYTKCYFDAFFENVLEVASLHTLEFAVESVFRMR